MNEKFFDLKKEKQDRIINAGLKAFAINGYRHASTDDIVAGARISKGLLFHYFSSKLGLYAFLFDYSVRFMALGLSSCTAGEQDDFFELLLKMESAKLQVLKNYPYMQLFIDSIRHEDVSEALAATEEKKYVLADARAAILKKADFSVFRPEVDADKLSRVIDYTIQGLMADRFLERSFQPDLFLEEVRAYLSMLKGLV